MITQKLRPRTLTRAAFLALALATLTVWPGTTRSAPDALRIAVASNFVPTLRVLVEDYASVSTQPITLSAASTGKLYAQIKQGAPFDLLLAADHVRPQRLHTEGLSQRPFTYAVGQLVLWRPNERTPCALVDQATLGRPPAEEQITTWLSQSERIAVAVPELAPYGMAARQAIDQLGLSSELEGRIVRAENIGQTFSMVATGNADAGLIARAQLNALLNNRDPDDRCASDVVPLPTHLHTPILQNASILLSGRNPEASRAFADYLRSERAKNIIIRWGYLSP